MTAATGVSRRLATRVRSWPLWSLPRRAALYIIGTQLLALTAILTALTGNTTALAAEWTRFATLFLAAGVQLAVSRDHEQRRHVVQGGRAPQADFTGIFLFPAAILLPVPLAAMLIVATRIARCRTSGEPLHRNLLTSASTVLAACSARGVFALGVDDTPSVEGWHLGEQLTLAACGFVYMVQQIIVVGVADYLSGATVAHPRRLLGDRDHGTNAAISIGLGFALSATAASPGMVAVMLVASVVLNRLARQVERGRRDGATGLATKERWTQLAVEVHSAAVRERRAVAVLVVDLDHFKAVNDQYGHLVGDMLLERVGQVLASSVRARDVVGRFGGEEFVVFLDHAAEAEAVAERIRQRIEQIEVRLDRRVPGVAPVVIGKRTASIGVAVSGVLGEQSLNELLDVADSALYAAKRNGRNQVWMARN